MVDDAELARAWWRWSFVNLLSYYDFPGDDTPVIVVGSALKALRG